ncbi:MAG: hypothetical protein P4L73_13375 [Caulobacteraceae bacterium]|nr:hypothetical protein [Caulobacteraceae bacterium]
MSELESYIRVGQRIRFAYGVHDCLLWPAGWVMVRGRGDPAAAFRGRYSTAAGARRFVIRHGGLECIARKGARSVGLEEIDPADALPGDVAVGHAGPNDWGDEPVGMIRAGRYWAALDARCGVVVGPATPLAAWRV